MQFASGWAGVKLALAGGMRCKRFLVPCLLSLFAASAEAQTIIWDATQEKDVAGYVLSWGTSPGVYSNRADVGNVTTYPMPATDASLDYYFAVQAYNSTGLLSDYSAEVKYAAAVPPHTTVLTSFGANTGYPLLVGRSVTWTAQATSRLGPVEYAFWLSTAAGWINVQNYSPSATFTWTPGVGDLGAHTVLVWARTVGSPASYEAWVASPTFNVNLQPVQLSASSDFPVPPGQPVTWTASVAGVASGAALEYRFCLFTRSSGKWTVLREYASSPAITWTPSNVDTYEVQVWVRRAGSTVAYDAYVGSGPVQVTKQPVTIRTLTSGATFPAATGQPITWTARASGGSAGPLAYSFWRLGKGGWTNVQPYSTSNTYTWTPTFSDAGTYTLQVWVRSAGSTATFEAYSSTGSFTVVRAPLQLTTDALFPVPPGTPITWTGSVSDPTAAVQYQFWVYTQQTGTWAIGQPYGASGTFVWTPPAAGTYGVQVWARANGSSATYDAWRGSDLFEIRKGPVQVLSLIPSVSFPALAGTSVRWVANAAGGSAAPLQYQFWVYSESSGWTLGRDYSSSNAFTWTAPGSGRYAVQVWVKSAGSPALYEGWMGSGFFDIQ